MRRHNHALESMTLKRTWCQFVALERLEKGASLTDISISTLVLRRQRILEHLLPVLLLHPNNVPYFENE